ncbi:hypothetical protein DTO271G3_3468 [Paecilomyces variotii]|nr:hypothetical protein DTO271G3_3468 [Paecilomyces variotii]
MSYTIAYDTSSAPSKGRELVSFMEEFYATSDDPAAHEKYARSFTPDATLIMGPKVGKGYDEILALRHGLWTHVASRKHTPVKIFFGGENELMLHGKVLYTLKATGNQVEVPWAGRVEFAFDEAGANPKMKFYQVYLDTASQSGK